MNSYNYFYLLPPRSSVFHKSQNARALFKFVITERWVDNWCQAQMHKKLKVKVHMCRNFADGDLN